MIRIHMVATDGLVTINSPDFAYSNIKGMYSAGLQVDESLDADLESEVMDICDQVAKLMYKLEDRLSAKA